MPYAIDFFDKNVLMGGTEMEASEPQAVEFADLGLSRHDASWARVTELVSGQQSLLCIRANGPSHQVLDPDQCRSAACNVECPALLLASQGQARD